MRTWSKNGAAVALLSGLLWSVLTSAALADVKDYEFQLVQSEMKKADGAIVAFHDVLGWQRGPCRVFANSVLLSQDFGACGLSGTIGWAQFVKDRQVAARHSQTNAKLHRALAPQISATAPSTKVSRIMRWRQLLLRNRYRQSPSPKQFLQRVEVLR